jgi:hypothetical protein
MMPDKTPTKQQEKNFGGRGGTKEGYSNVFDPFANNTMLLKQNQTQYKAGPITPAVNNVTNNYTINGVVSGRDIISALRNDATLKGRNILGLLGQ